MVKEIKFSTIFNPDELEHGQMEQQTQIISTRGCSTASRLFDEIFLCLLSYLIFKIPIIFSVIS